MKELSKLFKVLNKALVAYDIPLGYYSFGEFSEEAICIEKENDKWIVYLGERGKKHSITEYTNIIEACMDMIERLAESYDQEKKIKDNFLKNYSKDLNTENNTSRKAASYVLSNRKKRASLARLTYKKKKKEQSVQAPRRSHVVRRQRSKDVRA